MNTIYNVYDRSTEVMEDTWGHLKPEPGRKYNGWMLMYYSYNGHFGILDWEYEDLDGSPWQYIHFEAWIDHHIDTCNAVGMPLGAGVYRYSGWYLPYKNGGCRFQEKPWEVLNVNDG